MKILYKTTATAEGGLTGRVELSDSPFFFNMTPSARKAGLVLNGANPEQLFAAGYAACFAISLDAVIKSRKMSIPEPVVQVTVELDKGNGKGYFLSAEILVTFSGIDFETARELTDRTHLVCPYSKAVRGNMDVALAVKTD